MSKQLEQKVKQIEDTLNLQLKKRLKLRYQQKLNKHFSNCVFSTTMNRFYVCSHKKHFSKDNFLICTEEICSKCPLFTSKYNKQKINEEFKRDISDPAICGNKEPKIAVLLWVLNVLKDKNNNKQYIEKRSTIWDRIISFLKLNRKNGSVCR